MEKKRMTISDIAEAAGVSKATVSRCLNGKYTMMSPQTKERIENIIKLSGYRPSTIAQSLKSRRTMQIGVVIADISSPFSTAMLQGIGRVLDTHSYMPLIVNSGNDILSEEKYIGELIRRGVDGLLVNTSAYHNRELVRTSVEQGIPVVLCDRYVEDYNFDIVTSEKKAPIRRVLEHLKAGGFTAPYLFIEAYEENSTRYLRRKAFMDCLKEMYGNEKPEAHSILTDVQDPDASAACVQRIIGENRKKGVPAILTGNTVTTLHLLSVIKKLKLRIPRDLGICGPDDWNWGRQIEWPTLIDPGISTFSIDALRLGMNAAELLMERIRNPRGRKRKIVIPAEFTIRGSSVLGRK